jgi:cytochrome c-type biogenesis protein
MYNLLQAPLALAAGTLTILSPCVLPMLPILLGTGAGRPSGTRPVFVLAGFVTAFCALGMLLALASSAATFTSEAVRTAAIAALLISGLLRIWPRAYEWLTSRIDNPFQRCLGAGAPAAPGKAGGFLLGVSLGAVWTPCAGPVLASILALVAQAHDIGWSAMLLALYALGAAVPMLAVAYGGQFATSRLRVLSSRSHRVQQLFGLLVALTAIAIYFHLDVQFTSWLLSTSQSKGM